MGGEKRGMKALHNTMMGQRGSQLAWSRGSET